MTPEVVLDEIMAAVRATLPAWVPRRAAERPACDARCTNAPGPSCDCRCGGVNHGSGRVVAVELDAGGVPRLKVEHPDDLRARATEYRTAVGPLRERQRDMVARRAGEVYPWNRPSPTERWLGDQLARITSMRTHKGRLKAIAEVSERLRSET